MDAILQVRTDPDAKRELQVLTKVVLGGPVMPDLLECRRDVLDRLGIWHKVRGLLVAAVMRDSRVPREWKIWATAVSMCFEQDQKKLDRALEKTAALISESFSPPIILKGSSLSFGSVRDFGDVDLLINEQDLIPIINLLESHGYIYVGYERNLFIRKNEYRAWEQLKKWSNQFEFREPETGTLVELHTYFFETGRVYDEDLTRLRAALPVLKAASVTDPKTGYKCLCPEDRLLLLALHVVLKRSPLKKAFILRHLFDFQNAVTSKIDWDLLGNRSRSFNLDFHLSALIHLCERFSGSLTPVSFLESLDARLSRKELWLRDQFAFSLRETDFYCTWAVVNYRLTAPFILEGTIIAKVKSLLLIAHWIPPRYKLVERYRLQRDSAFIMFFYLIEPFRWAAVALHTLIRNLKRRLSLCPHQ